MIQITFTHTVKSSHLGNDINELIEQGFAEIRDAIYVGYTQLIKDNVILNCSAVTNEIIELCRRILLQVQKIQNFSFLTILMVQSFGKHMVLIGNMINMKLILILLTLTH